MISFSMIQNALLLVALVLLTFVSWYPPALLRLICPAPSAICVPTNTSSIGEIPRTISVKDILYLDTTTSSKR